MYKNYIFDLYGTLVDIHTDEENDLLWDKMAYFYGFHGASYSSTKLKDAYTRLCQEKEDYHSQIEDYEIELTEVFQELFHIKGIEASPALAVKGGEFFRILSLDYIKLYDGAVDLLEELKNRGKAIYLLSNAQRVFTEPELGMLGIKDYFDDIFISSDFAFKKPSPRFYEELITKHKLNKGDSLMIGNDPTTDIKGANLVGLSSLYIHTNLSPDLEGKVESDFIVMDADLGRVKDLILA